MAETVSFKDSLFALKGCKDCIHVDVCRYRNDPGSKNCIFKHSSNDVRPVVRGRWVEKPYLLGTTNVCSVCGENYGMPHGKFKFCPSCGADMREEKP